MEHGRMVVVEAHVANGRLRLMVGILANRD